MSTSISSRCLGTNLYNPLCVASKSSNWDNGRPDEHDDAGVGVSANDRVEVKKCCAPTNVKLI